MELEYRNGVRLTDLAHEQSPLDAAMNNYERMARKHISQYGEMAKKHYAEDKTLTEKQREEGLEASLRFLALERDRLTAIASVQAQLEAYREGGMAATKGSAAQKRQALTMLSNEKHHPTEVLEKYMRAEGVPKPSSKHTAHHIVPGKGKIKKNLLTRVHLHRYGVRINDPANGVYLLHKDEYAPHWSMPKSRGHLTYHTEAYETWVHNRVMNQRHIDFLKTELQVIGRILQDNEPKDAIPKMK